MIPPRHQYNEGYDQLGLHVAQPGPRCDQTGRCMSTLQQGKAPKGLLRALAIIDTSTALIKILPPQDGSNAEAAFLLDRYWLNRFPRPKEVFEVLDSYGIEHAPTTVRNPQDNAVIER
ncbi:Pol Polyprotein [Phytophthora megakarya]|uniref:Pol Polyprotein n=1 Tax=Phytophthora megakarya TaxID=4795 RepID=A0A225UJD4_9STRA|nr:Pol Polyprotein [Phytophthora megakarya]